MTDFVVNEVSELACVVAPTAVQLVAEVHDTPLKIAPRPFGLGVALATIVHFVPFQRRTNVRVQPFEPVS
jgi:hypothetical protein